LIVDRGADTVGFVKRNRLPMAEMRGQLSHAATLACQYGLPAVVSVPGATRRLRDGDRIEPDSR
jgi:phosphohistidine swiveling domain-containing protein